MINLHLHTNKSLDGKLNINEVLEIAEQKNISYISITDHNTCAAYQEINNSNYQGIIIPGIEADAIIGHETYDILCYGFNLENISKWAKDQYTTIEERQTKIFNALKKICQTKSINLNETKPFNPKEEYAHAAIFRMLDDNFKKDHNLSTINDLYRESTINKSFPLYLDMKIVWPTIEEVRDIIHQNGGLVFLAHPYKYGRKNIEELLQESLPYIDGIEVINDNTKEETEYLYNFAQENNLLVSCGSDFHGTPKHNDLIFDIPTEIQNKIINWIETNQNIIKN